MTSYEAVSYFLMEKLGYGHLNNGGLKGRILEGFPINSLPKIGEEAEISRRKDLIYRIFTDNIFKGKDEKTLINYFSSMGLKENFPSGRFIQFKEHDEMAQWELHFDAPNFGLTVGGYRNKDISKILLVEFNASQTLIKKLNYITEKANSSDSKNI